MPGPVRCRRGHRPMGRHPDPELHELRILVLHPRDLPTEGADLPAAVSSAAHDVARALAARGKQYNTRSAPREVY